jgi:hypothetical protein
MIFNLVRKPPAYSFLSFSAILFISSLDKEFRTLLPILAPLEEFAHSLREELSCVNEKYQKLLHDRQKVIEATAKTIEEIEVCQDLCFNLSSDLAAHQSI